MDKYKENKLNISFEPEYKTPAFNKFQSERYENSTTFESEVTPFGIKANREEVGRDLKMKWTQNMKEFDLSGSKSLINTKGSGQGQLNQDF